MATTIMASAAQLMEAEVEASSTCRQAPGARQRRWSAAAGQPLSSAAGPSCRRRVQMPDQQATPTACQALWAQAPGSHSPCRTWGPPAAGPAAGQRGRSAAPSCPAPPVQTAARATCSQQPPGVGVLPQASCPLNGAVLASRQQMLQGVMLAGRRRRSDPSPSPPLLADGCREVT